MFLCNVNFMTFILSFFLFFYFFIFFNKLAFTILQPLQGEKKTEGGARPLQVGGGGGEKKMRI
jgi:hypothetical protein